MNLAHFMTNLKAIFALPKWAKVFLGVLSVITVVVIIAVTTLNKSVRGEIYSANLVLKSQKSLETSNQIAYNLWIDFPKFKPLLRSKSISRVDIAQFLWDKSVDKNAIENIRSGGRNIWLESTQNLGMLGVESLGKVEYKIDFSPLLWNIVKIFVAILTLTLLLTNIIKHRYAPFGKYDYALAFILSLITLILCVGQVNSGHNWGGDFSGYISQAIALANGTTAQYIADNTLMMSKCDWLYGPYAYPWGFPMLLAPIYKIFGFNIYAFKSVGIICYTLFVGIFYIFCVNRLPRIYAIFATLFFALNPYITNFAANEILSDIPFMLFGFIALITLAKLFGKSKSRNNGICIAIFGGIFMLFASLIRINGFVIFCALLTMHGIILAKRFAPNLFKAKFLKPFSIIDSPYSWQIHSIPYAIFIIGFAIVSITLSSGGSGHFGALSLINGAMILNNADYYIEIFKDFFINNGRLATFALCMPLIYFGIKGSLKGTNSVRFSENIFFVIFACGFLALLLLWVGTQGIRFVYLLLPFMTLWGSKGLAELNANKQFFGRFMNILLLIILANYTLVARKVNFEVQITTSGAYTKEAKEIWAFIDENTPKNAVILFHKPRVLYLNAHRISFTSNNIARFDEADFVLWERDLWNGYEGINIDSSAFLERTELIYKNAQFKLYKVIQ